jgi:hypothetical protein
MGNIISVECENNRFAFRTNSQYLLQFHPIFRVMNLKGYVILLVISFVLFWWRLRWNNLYKSVVYSFLVKILHYRYILLLLRLFWVEGRFNS